MAKKATKGPATRRRKTTRARDLSAGPKARTAKGGAFSTHLSSPGHRYTIK